MDKIWKRFFVYVVVVFSAILVFSLVYDWGMSVFEGRDRTFLRSLQVVVETFTTTGYGEDAPWLSPQLIVLVILMQFSGIVLIFLALPLFIIPWIEAVLSSGPPRSVGKLSGHVIVCGYSGYVDSLIEEFESRGVEYVVIVEDRDEAVRLYESGVSVIYGGLESLDSLESAWIGFADTLIVNSSDERNASIILSAQEEDFDVRIVSIVSDTSVSGYLRYAGADEVISPKYLLGRALGVKASAAVSQDLGNSVEIGEDFEIVEFPVQSDSQVFNSKFSELGIRERTGTSVIGVWVEGDFLGAPSPDLVIDDDMVLLVAGREDQLEEVRKMTLSESRRYFPRNVLVAGYGTVGSIACETLEKSGTPYFVVDEVDKDGVDFVGDSKNESTLIDSGIDEVSVLVVALPDDTDSIFTILASNKLNPDAEIISRANKVGNSGKMYKAGADYVLSLESITGRILAMNILKEDVLTLKEQIKIIRVYAPGLVGKSLREADVRSNVGCIVVGIQRDDKVITELGADFVVEPEDKVIVAGTDRDVNDFLSEYGG